jgi:hypothetical protein
MLPLVVLLLDLILSGQLPSIFELIVVSAGVLIAGLLFRQGAGRTGRLLGAVLALVGGLALAGLGALVVAGPMGY